MGIMNDLYLVNGAAVGFYVLIALDQREHLGLVYAVGDALQDADDAKSGQMSIALLIIVMLVFVRNPIFTMVGLTVMYDYHDFTDTKVNACAISVFSAAVTALVFRLFGRVIVYSADTIFYCFALEAEGGEHQARMVKLYDMLETQKRAELGNESLAESTSDEEEA